MAHRLVRRLKSVEDQEHIADYIARDSLASAIRFLECAEKTLRQLADSPGLGSRIPLTRQRFSGIRCWRVDQFPNYLIYYRHLSDEIEVIRILHGARDLESELKNF